MKYTVHSAIAVNWVEGFVALSTVISTPFFSFTQVSFHMGNLNDSIMVWIPVFAQCISFANILSSLLALAGPFGNHAYSFLHFTDLYNFVSFINHVTSPLQQVINKYHKESWSIYPWLIHFRNSIDLPTHPHMKFWVPLLLTFCHVENCPFNFAFYFPSALVIVCTMHYFTFQSTTVYFS